MPSLTDTTEGDFAGFGLTFDFLNKKARNHRYVNKKRIGEDVSGEASSEAPTKKDVEAALKFLKTVVVSSKNIDQIRSKLVITAAHRTQMIKTTKLDFLTEFPIFFTYPETVRVPNLFYFFHF